MDRLYIVRTNSGLKFHSCCDNFIDHDTLYTVCQFNYTQFTIDNIDIIYAYTYTCIADLLTD